MENSIDEIDPKYSPVPFDQVRPLYHDGSFLLRTSWIVFGKYCAFASAQPEKNDTPGYSSSVILSWTYYLSRGGRMVLTRFIHAVIWQGVKYQPKALSHAGARD